MDQVDNQAYQEGRTAGRIISTFLASFETAAGVATTVDALLSIPPTVGGGTICTGATGGVCALGAVPALAGEVVIAYYRKSDQSTLFYNKQTNEFSVLNKNNKIKTYFKPENKINYWNQQIGK